MHWHIRALLTIAIIGAAAPTMAGEAAPSTGIKFENPARSRWRIGVEITAGRGGCSGIVATMPVPMDWPEQQVSIVDENVSSPVRPLEYRILDSGVKQLVVSVPNLAAGETATAIVTFDVTKSTIEAPDDPSQFVFAKTPPRDVRGYLLPSPYIESRDRKIQTLADEILVGKEQQPAWQQVGAIFDWVRANVQYKFDVRIKTCVAALNDGVGDCEELSSLFIALCRANKIPARAVWVPGHTYPEFYLQDAAGNGHWFPCQAAGAARDFGRMPEPRPILQKGDNFKVPGQRQPQRYVQQSLSARNAPEPPEVKWVLETVPAE